MSWFFRWREGGDDQTGDDDDDDENEYESDYDDDDDEDSSYSSYEDEDVVDDDNDDDDEPEDEENDDVNYNNQHNIQHDITHDDHNTNYYNNYNYNNNVDNHDHVHMNGGGGGFEEEIDLDGIHSMTTTTDTTIGIIDVGHSSIASSITKDSTFITVGGGGGCIDGLNQSDHTDDDDDEDENNNDIVPSPNQNHNYQNSKTKETRVVSRSLYDDMNRRALNENEKDINAQYPNNSNNNLDENKNYQYHHHSQQQQDQEQKQRGRRHSPTAAARNHEFNYFDDTSGLLLGSTIPPSVYVNHDPSDPTFPMDHHHHLQQQQYHETADYGTSQQQQQDQHDADNLLQLQPSSPSLLLLSGPSMFLSYFNRDRVTSELSMADADFFLDPTTANNNNNNNHHMSDPIDDNDDENDNHENHEIINTHHYHDTGFDSHNNNNSSSSSVLLDTMDDVGKRNQFDVEKHEKRNLEENNHPMKIDSKDTKNAKKKNIVIHSPNQVIVNNSKETFDNNNNTGSGGGGGGCEKDHDDDNNNDDDDEEEEVTSFEEKESILRLAAEHDRVDIMQAILNPTPPSTSSSSKEKKISSSKQKDTQHVHDRSILLNPYEHTGIPPLHIAIANGSLNAINCLLRLGADPSIRPNVPAIQEYYDQKNQKNNHNNKQQQQQQQEKVDTTFMLRYANLSAWELVFGCRTSATDNKNVPTPPPSASRWSTSWKLKTKKENDIAVTLPIMKLDGIRTAFTSEAIRCIGGDEVERLQQLLNAGLPYSSTIGPNTLVQWSIDLDAKKCHEVLVFLEQQQQQQVTNGGILLESIPTGAGVSSTTSGSETTGQVPTSMTTTEYDDNHKNNDNTNQQNTATTTHINQPKQTAVLEKRRLHHKKDLNQEETDNNNNNNETETVEELQNRYNELNALCQALTVCYDDVAEEVAVCSGLLLNSNPNNNTSSNGGGGSSSSSRTALTSHVKTLKTKRETYRNEYEELMIHSNELDTEYDDWVTIITHLFQHQQQPKQNGEEEEDEQQQLPSQNEVNPPLPYHTVEELLLHLQQHIQSQCKNNKDNNSKQQDSNNNNSTIQPIIKKDQGNDHNYITSDNNHVHNNIENDDIDVDEQIQQQQHQLRALLIVNENRVRQLRVAITDLSDESNRLLQAVQHRGLLGGIQLVRTIREEIREYQHEQQQLFHANQMKSQLIHSLQTVYNEITNPTTIVHSNHPNHDENGNDDVLNMTTTTTNMGQLNNVGMNHEITQYDDHQHNHSNSMIGITNSDDEDGYGATHTTTTSTSETTYGTQNSFKSESGLNNNRPKVVVNETAATTLTSFHEENKNRSLLTLWQIILRIIGLTASTSTHPDHSSSQRSLTSLVGPLLPLHHTPSHRTGGSNGNLLRNQQQQQHSSFHHGRTTTSTTTTGNNTLKKTTGQMVGGVVVGNNNNRKVLYHRDDSYGGGGQPILFV